MSEVIRYSREPIDPQINLVAYDSEDGDTPTLVVNTNADRGTLSRLRAYKHQVLMWVPGLHMLTDTIRRAWENQPVATTAAGVAMFVIGAGGIELAITTLPISPPPAVHQHEHAPLEHVRLKSHPRPGTTARTRAPASPSIHPMARPPRVARPLKAASQASPRPATSPTPTPATTSTPPGPVVTPHTPHDLIQARRPRLNTPARAVVVVPVAPAQTPSLELERSAEPFEESQETAGLDPATVDSSTAPAADIPTP